MTESDNQDIAENADSKSQQSQNTEFDEVDFLLNMDAPKYRRLRNRLITELKERQEDRILSPNDQERRAFIQAHQNTDKEEKPRFIDRIRSYVRGLQENSRNDRGRR